MKGRSRSRCKRNGKWTRAPTCQIAWMARNKISCLVTFLCCICCSGKSQEDYTRCGIRALSIRTRIIGGKQSYPGQWPWQVALYKDTNDGSGKKKFLCGGALIDTRWVLTTAHCFYQSFVSQGRIRHIEDSSYPNKYTIIAGDHNIKTKDFHEQKRQVTKILLYPGYRHYPYYENDIALVKLSQNITLTPYVRTICLPEAGENLSTPGVDAHVAGWGKTNVRSLHGSSVLLHSVYQIQNNDLCQRATRHFFNKSVTLCVGDGKGGNDTCQGDSGGSLVRRVLHKGVQRWVTVGLVSWGEGCGERFKYGYYTRMEPFVEWIQKSTTMQCKDPGNIRNGVRIPDKRNYLYRDKVAFKCQKNYTRIGASSIACQRDGTWSGYRALCLAPCRDPGIPDGGVRLDHSFKHGQTVRFVCKGKSFAQDISFITCFDGRWKGEIQSCAPNRPCSNPWIQSKGPTTNPPLAQGQSTKHGTTVTFSCRPRFTLEGQRTISCENGRWSGNVPMCKAVECKNPGKPVNGGRIPDKDKYVFEDRIDFQCKTNYTIRGDSFIICRKTKDWTGSIPQCLAPCSNPGIPVGGRRLQHSFLHSKVVQFQCNRGWSMEGAHTIRCTNGQWDYPAPTCSDCGSALGMYGNIRASSVRDWYHQAKDGRLNGPRAWCSGSEQNPYIEIDFGKPYQLTSLATQGSAVDNRWVGSFAVKINLAGSRFTSYREHNTDKMFQGNTNGNSVVRNRFSERIIARRIRIYPMKLGGFLRQPACMRVEIYGCDLPLDCVMIKSRIVAKWNSNYYGAYIYYKAYLTDTTNRSWKVELENERHGNPKYKNILKYEDLPFVLDVPPRHEELQVGTRVLAPWGVRYYTGTIETARDSNNRYQVKADDDDRATFTTDQIRLLKAPTFCN